MSREWLGGEISLLFNQNHYKLRNKGSDKKFNVPRWERTSCTKSIYFHINPHPRRVELWDWGRTFSPKADPFYYSSPGMVWDYVYKPWLKESQLHVKWTEMISPACCIDNVINIHYCNSQRMNQSRSLAWSWSSFHAASFYAFAGINSPITKIIVCAGL